jgi:dolichyl-diphosphooligosaccharide--protein glycosyltransferase
MDHPVAEIFFSTLAVLFLILAIKAAGGKQDGQEPMTFNHLIKGDRKVITTPLVFSALAGLFLGIYLITWLGALLFVFIAAIYLIIQTIVNHIKQKSSEHLGIVGFITFLIAFIVFLPFNSNANLTLAMAAALFVPVAMAFSSRFVFKWGLSPFYYPVILIVLAGAIFGVIYAASPATVSTLWGYFLSVFSPGGSTATTTMEMQPFLSPQGSFTTAVAWGSFTTSFFMTESLAIPGFGLISFVILLWLYIKHRGKEESLLLFLIWTLIILITTLSQRRFAYYLAINIAVLSAYISGQIIWLGGLRRFFTNTETSPGNEKIENSKVKTKKKKQNQGFPIFQVTSVLLIIVVFILVYMFNISKSVETAKTAPYAPSDGWEESLTWMRDNTPEPLGDKEAYYKIYDTSFKYPESAYGVTAWWDYGYWITRTAHRIPSANPSQDPVAIKKVANLFISQDTATTQKAMEELDSSYVVLDFALITSKFWAVFDWSKQDQNKYFGIYLISKDGAYYPVQLMKPDFYRTLAVRLYAFDGKAVADGKPLVITYEEKTSGGNTYKIVTKYEEFSSLKAAQNFIAVQTSGKYDIVGASEFVSPVPLEAVPNFKLAYSSQYQQTHTQNITVPEIKIFEYVK